MKVLLTLTSLLVAPIAAASQTMISDVSLIDTPFKQMAVLDLYERNAADVLLIRTNINGGFTAIAQFDLEGASPRYKLLTCKHTKEFYERNKTYKYACIYPSTYAED